MRRFDSALAWNDVIFLSCLSWSWQFAWRLPSMSSLSTHWQRGCKGVLRLDQHLFVSAPLNQLLMPEPRTHQISTCWSRPSWNSLTCMSIYIAQECQRGAQPERIRSTTIALVSRYGAETTRRCDQASHTTLLLTKMADIVTRTTEEYLTGLLEAMPATSVQSSNTRQTCSAGSPAELHSLSPRTEPLPLVFWLAPGPQTALSHLLAITQGKEDMRISMPATCRARRLMSAMVANSA